MSFKRFVAGATFLAVLAMAARVSIDSDTFWHLAAGRWIWEHGQILRVDPFSISRAGHPWVYPGWLAQVAMFGLYRASGYLGLNVFTMVAVFVSFSLLWGVLQGKELLRGFVIILAAASSAIFWSARPQMLTLVLTSAFLIVLERHRVGAIGWRLWLLPIFMALWSNIHGGFIAGFLAIFAFLVGELIELALGTLLSKREWQDLWQPKRSYVVRLISVTLACVLAVSFNPFGPQMLLYPFQTISVDTLSNYIQEWQSPNFHQTNTWPFLLMLFLSVASFSLSKEQPKGHEILLFVGLGGLALYAARNIALFSLAGALVLSRHFSSAVKPLAEAIGPGRQVPARLSRRLNLVGFLLLLLAVVLWGLPRISSQSSRSVIADRFPKEAVDYLVEASNDDPIFHTYRWGGYLIWRGYPMLMSFVDGRTDLFGDEILNQYLGIVQAEEGFADALNRWEVKWILIEPQAPLASAARRAGWPIIKSGKGFFLIRVE